MPHQVSNVLSKISSCLRLRNAGLNGVLGYINPLSVVIVDQYKFKLCGFDYSRPKEQSQSKISGYHPVSDIFNVNNYENLLFGDIMLNKHLLLYSASKFIKLHLNVNNLKIANFIKGDSVDRVARIIQYIQRTLTTSYLSVEYATEMEQKISKLFMCNYESCPNSVGIPIIDISKTCDQFQVLDYLTKNAFFDHVTENFDILPSNFLKYKILKIIELEIKFNASSMYLIKCFYKIMNLEFSDFEYTSQVLPILTKIFHMSDRIIRVELLDHLLHCNVGYTSNNIYFNKNIVPHLFQGFKDSNSTIREKTIFVATKLVTHYDYPNLNDKFFKYLIGPLLKDPDVNIRRNTLVSIRYVASNVDASLRSKVLAPILLSKLDDDQPTVVLAAISAILELVELFSVNHLATRIIPGLSPLLINPNLEVRNNSFKVVNQIIQVLEGFSKNPAKLVDWNKQSNVHSGVINPSWSKWALDSVMKINEKLSTTFTSNKHNRNTESEESEPKKDINLGANDLPDSLEKQNYIKTKFNPPPSTENTHEKKNIKLTLKKKYANIPEDEIKIDDFCPEINEIDQKWPTFSIDSIDNYQKNITKSNGKDKEMEWGREW
ncbi:hypothetical protein A3Q56_00086 [Intoshia linei]|uniref:TOG domain-containing protein n=1 Tax=Intoshia linei TaxID=1819745 RepID=A0A177BD56_9BILA|nr:hypothetical protein A3Q56_00086 [Intoshia linei]